MELSVNLTIQYIFVGIILLAILVWTIVRFIRLRKQGAPDSCCGCSLGDACGKRMKAQKKQPRHNDCADKQCNTQIHKP